MASTRHIIVMFLGVIFVVQMIILNSINYCTVSESATDIIIEHVNQTTECNDTNSEVIIKEIIVNVKSIEYLTVPETQWDMENGWIPGVSWMNGRFKSLKEDFSVASRASGLYSRCAMKESVQLKVNDLLNKTIDDLPLCKRKKVAVVLGLVFWLGIKGQRGSPLGELIQWTDLIQALMVIGHDVTVIDDEQVFERYKFSLSQFDIVYCDYHLTRYNRENELIWNDELKPKIRLLDTFGTQQLFNDINITEAEKHKVFREYCCLQIHAKQYYTFYPHTEENTFLGYVVQSPDYHDHAGSTLSTKDDRGILNITYLKKNQVLIWGKESGFWKGSQDYLDLLSKSFQIHGTYDHGYDGWEVPNYVINHNIMEPGDWGKYVEESKLFIGLGFPYDGPSPLEAMARGTKYINPVFNEPHYAGNTERLYGKPTLRKYTSQHPYLERFEGHVMNIDIHNQTQVESMIQWALSLKDSDFNSFIPEDFRVLTFIRRVFELTQYQEFEMSQGKVQIKL